MSEEDVTQTTETEPLDDDAAIAAEVAQEIGISEVKTDKATSALIATKKALREANRRIKDLEPVAARTKEIEDKLEAASPYIQAISNSPRLKAEAIRAVSGTRTSADTTEQPEDDPEAREMAEILGLYLADGHTLDLARAQRSMAILDKRNGRTVDARMAPLAGTVLGDRADQNVRHVINMRDDHGNPYATEESIREVVKMMGAGSSHLIANPQVTEMILRQAIGEDRLKGRTPRSAPDEPLWMESAGGRGRKGPAIDPDLKAAAERLGISESDLAASTKRLEEGVQNRRGIALGGKN